MAKKSLQELLAGRTNKPPVAPEKKEELKKINDINALFAKPEEKKPEESKSIDLNDLFAKKKTTPPSTQPAPKKEEKPTALIDTNNFTYEGQPEKLEEKVMADYHDNMEILRQNMEDKSLISQSLANILQMIKEHSFLSDNLADEDCGTMIQALKKSHSVVLLEKKSRSKSPTGKTAVKMKEAEDMLAGIDFGDI